MNEAGVEVLVKAALQGRRQARGVYRDHFGGRCAMGFLAEAAGVHAASRVLDAPEIVWNKFGFVDRLMACPECDVVEGGEESMIVHLNDEHEWDLISIARKLGPDSEGGPIA